MHLIYITGKQCKNTEYIYIFCSEHKPGWDSVMYESEPGNRTIYSVAKSAVFSWNWATLTMLSQVIFHVRGFERPQLYVIFSPWTANFTKVTPPKNMYLPPGTQFLLVDPPLNAIGLVLG